MAEPTELEPTTSDVTGPVCLKHFNATKLVISELRVLGPTLVVTARNAHASFTGTPTAHHSILRSSISSNFSTSARSCKRAAVFLFLIKWCREITKTGMPSKPISKRSGQASANLTPSILCNYVDPQRRNADLEDGFRSDQILQCEIAQWRAEV
jgi:hypothetical protein